MPSLPPQLASAMGGQPPVQPAGAGTLPGQPPFGSSPMTPPVPHRGLEGKGMALVAQAQKLLQEAIAQPGLGAETPVGKAIVDCLKALGKAVPDGAVSPGQESAGMQQFMLQQRQQNPLTNLIAALGQGAPGGAPPPMAAPPAM